MIRLHNAENENFDPYEGQNKSAYQWCLHCERTYKRGEYRLIQGLRMCPYPGCDGDTVMDGWDWDQLRRQLPQYSEIPEPGVRYELYPKDFPVLTEGARKILVYLVAEIRKGRFDPGNERTFCKHKEVHETLGFFRIATQWSGSLETHGLTHLHKWTRTHQLPAIAGLVLSEKKPRRPDPFYYKEYGMPDGSTDWWREQIKAAIEFNWSEWI